MRATAALFAKELDQHRSALLGVSALLLVAWIMGGATFAHESRTLSELERLGRFLNAPLLVGVVYLGHRLVVSELYARTYRFLEGLPLSRWHALLVKVVVGYLVILAWALAALAWGLLAASSREPLGARFVAVLLSRVAGYTFCVWGVVFLFGCFGRLRILLAVVATAVLVLIDRQSTLDLGQFGPLALVDPDRLPYERTVLPAGDLLEAAAVGLGAFVVGFSVQSVREGSLAESLARRMSPREWSALVVVVLVSIFTLAVVERQTPAEPYQPTTDRVWEAPGGLVRVSYAEDELRPAAQSVGTELAASMAGLATGLSISPMRLDLVHGPDVRPGRVLLDDGDASVGLVVRANLAAALDRSRATGAGHADLVADVLHAVLSVHSRGRARREPHHWFLDGFVQHFAVHGRVAAAPEPGRDPGALDPWLVAGLQVAPRTFDHEVLRAYHPLSERMGDPGVMVFSATGVRVLELRIGRARLLELARATLGRAPRGHLRDFLHGLRRPFSAELSSATGLDVPAFARLWSEQLARWRQLPEAAARLSALPRGQGWVVDDQPRGPTKLWLRLRWEPPGPRAELCTVRHQRLPWRAVHVDEDDHEEESFTVTAVASPGATLDRAFPVGYGAGERAFVAVDCELPGLPVEQRLIGQRVTVP